MRERFPQIPAEMVARGGFALAALEATVLLHDGGMAEIAADPEQMADLLFLVGADDPEPAPYASYSNDSRRDH